MFFYLCIDVVKWGGGVEGGVIENEKEKGLYDTDWKL